MDISEYMIKTPWDSRVFGLETFEIINVSEDILDLVFKNNPSPGHYTVKINPLSSKRVLQNYGFYYCDTLIEPYCNINNFIKFQEEKISINDSIGLTELIRISHRAFSHGRFHRDFNLDKNLADIRYELWLKDIYESKGVFGLIYATDLAGFWGFTNNKIVLHALSEEYRGRGLAKYFWSLACQELFSRGHQELISSISASNVRVLNLYSSLGFRFRNPLDVYHLLIK